MIPLFYAISTRMVIFSNICLYLDWPHTEATPPSALTPASTWSSNHFSISILSLSWSKFSILSSFKSILHTHLYTQHSFAFFWPLTFYHTYPPILHILNLITQPHSPSSISNINIYTHTHLLPTLHTHKYPHFHTTLHNIYNFCRLYPV